MTQWKTCFFQKTYRKFKIGILEHRNMNSGLLQFRKHAWCFRCQTKMKKAGSVKPCFCTRHICGYVASLDGEGNGTPLQYSCLENPMDGGVW